jgi:hypothetical protein
MSPVEILRRLYDAGVELFAAGAKLHYRAAPGAYTPELRDLVARHRAALEIELQRIACDLRDEAATWPEGAREAYEERAAILEHDAGLPREVAERWAFEEVNAAVASDAFGRHARARAKEARHA